MRRFAKIALAMSLPLLLISESVALADPSSPDPSVPDPVGAATATPSAPQSPTDPVPGDASSLAAPNEESSGRPLASQPPSDATGPARNKPREGAQSSTHSVEAPQAEATDLLSASVSPSATNPQVAEVQPVGQPTINTAGYRAVGLATNAWGSVQGGAGLQVWTEANVNGSWSRSQVGVVSASGQYSLPLTYGTNNAGEYYFRVGVATPSGERLYSAPATLTRLAVPSFQTAGERGVGITSYGWGSVESGSSLPVWTEAWVGGVWSRSQSGVAGPSGYFALPLTYGMNSIGTATFRVGVRHPSGHVTYSPARTLARVGSIEAHSAGSKLVGQTTYAWGRARGFAPGTVIWSEAWVNGRWVGSQYTRAAADGSFSLPLTYGMNTPGTYTFVMTARDQTGKKHQSNQIRLERTTIDARCMSGRTMCISKADRKLRWMINGRVIQTLDARFGCPSTPTREGLFKVNWKSYNHTSSLYESWMPRAMFFNGGQAVHYSSDFAARGWNGCSHGCVNIRDFNGIDWLYSQVRLGDRVVVY